MDMDKNHKSIYQNEEIYRPPLERDSALLEVQLGCSYGRCAFCDFIRDEFRQLPLEHISANIQILAQREQTKTTLFLLGQNALCLPTKSLLEIFGWVREYMPNIQDISLYGRADDIIRKGPEDLAKLKKAGLSILHVGVESGSDIVLRRMNKGVLSKDILTALHLLDAAGLYYHTTYILGLGGRPHWREHVEDTIRLFNQIKPLSIWALNLKLWPDTPLFQDAEDGYFEPLLPEEMLMEERLIIEQLNIPDCLYMDTTALNQFTFMGILPDDREKLLKAVDGMLAPYDLTNFLYL